MNSDNPRNYNLPKRDKGIHIPRQVNGTLTDMSWLGDEMRKIDIPLEDAQKVAEWWYSKPYSERKKIMEESKC